MSSDSATTVPVPAPAGKPRLANPKLLAVGGAAALALLLAVGAIAWALRAARPDPAATKARTARAQTMAASPAPAASAPASAAPPAMTTAEVIAPQDAARAGGPGHLAAAATAPLAAPSTPAHGDDAVPPAAAPRAAAASAADTSSAEAPFDRLQRRLGQVFGARAQVGVQGGEWRVLTRASTVETAAHLAPDPHPLAAAGPAPAAHQGPVQWSYEGRGGPQAWGRLKAEFASCASGRRQSPIDIRDGLALDLEPVRFDYHPSSFGVIDTGHTVQVNFAAGNAIELDGRRYELLQLHFHRPSEERINGRQFEMDVHLVHRDAEGRLAVVAVLLERGAALPFLQTVWNHLPLEKGEEAPARVPIDPSDLLPTDRRYYTYMGSLTTPPCSEGVRWVVLQRPSALSAAQIDIFARLYPMNARPIQQASGRLVKQSN